MEKFLLRLALSYKPATKRKRQHCFSLRGLADLKATAFRLQVTSYVLQVNGKFNHIKFPGGERGIRTLGTAFGSTHDFQSCSFSQLGHLSGTPAYAWYYLL